VGKASKSMLILSKKHLKGILSYTQFEKVYDVKKKTLFLRVEKKKDFSGRGGFYHFFKKRNVIINLFNKVVISVQKEVH
jgi:hypothetical protein